jgi:hypothetical protein
MVNLAGAFEEALGSGEEWRPGQKAAEGEPAKGEAPKNVEPPKSE